MSTLFTSDAAHIEHERTYLAAIGEALAAGPEPMRTRMGIVEHTYIPVLEFPDYDLTDPVAVWGDWEGIDPADKHKPHRINIVAAPFDEFPLLPDGTGPDDVAAAVAQIRAWFKDRANS